jgi:hypothetical protein
MIIIGGVVSFWGFSILKCEILTIKYGKEFYGLEVEETENKAETMKVLKYNDNLAQVYYKNYYPSRDNVIGTVFTFRRQDRKWIQTEWETKWSKGGSADERVWPYFWDGITILEPDEPSKLYCSVN